MRNPVTIPLLLIAGYLLICAVVYFNQDNMLFFPARAGATELEAFGKREGFEPWTNSRGERIGWKSTGADSRDALLVFHGNGGFALGQNYEQLRHTAGNGFQLFLLEYPGYGARPGPTSAKTLTAAAIDAIDTLADRPDRRLWILGQSLGSGIACAATAARPDKIAGLVLLTPFDTLSAAASTHYPWLPVRLLMRHRLDSDQNLQKYHGPVAIIAAGNDGTIPPKHAERLYELYAGPKKLWLVPGVGHNDFDTLMHDWSQIVGWLHSAVPDSTKN